MPMRRVTLPPDVPGELWLGPMPGRFDSWAEFEGSARRLGLDLVVCLTPRSELAELSPQYQAAVDSGQLAFRWQHLPMPNFGVPRDPQGFRTAVQDLASGLRAGHSVFLHCAAGIGRTGSTAACVLKALGVPLDDALEHVRAAGSNPQNAEQSGLVGWF